MKYFCELDYVYAHDNATRRIALQSVYESVCESDIQTYKQTVEKNLSHLDYRIFDGCNHVVADAHLESIITNSCRLHDF